MKKTFFKVIALFACVCMIASAFVGCGKEKVDAIVIGLSGPLTGGAAVYGTAVKNSAQMAVDEINAEAEKNGGLKLHLIMLDDANDASKIKANYSSLMSDGMQVSLGCVTTQPGLEFATHSNKGNVFFITPSATGDAIVNNDNAYQMCFSDNSQGTFAAEYVNSLNLTKIGVFYQSDNDYSKGIYNNFKAAINKSVEIVETSFLENDKDFSQQITKLSDCSFIFMPIYYTPASIFMTQAKGKIANGATYYGCDGFDGITSMEGFDIKQIPQKVSMLSHFDSSATEGKAKEFIDKYTKKYGASTLNQFGASAYDCVYAIYAAMNKAIKEGKNITHDISAADLCKILKEQFNGDFTYTNGVTGDSMKWNVEKAARPGLVFKDAKAFVLKDVSTPAN